ncbi:MAG: HEPN domain-containing protein [Aureispira sp.]
MSKIEDAVVFFRNNIDNVFNLIHVYELHTQTNVEHNADDILRAAIAMGISALDSFFHEFMVGAIVDIYANNSIKNYSNNLLKPSDNPHKLLSILSKSKQEQLKEIEQALYSNLKTKTFQNPEIIAENMKLIGIEQLWSDVQVNITEQYSVQDLKSRLELIVDRRHKIVHEADMNRSTGTKNEIELEEVRNDIIFIKEIGEAVFMILQ